MVCMTSLKLFLNKMCRVRIKSATTLQLLNVECQQCLHCLLLHHSAGLVTSHPPHPCNGPSWPWPWLTVSSFVKLLPSAELHRAALQSPLARAGLPTDWGLCEEICKLAGVQLHAEIVIQGTIRTHQGKHVGKVIQAKIYLDLQLKIFG